MVGIRSQCSLKSSIYSQSLVELSRNMLKGGVKISVFAQKLSLFTIPASATSSNFVALKNSVIHFL